MQDGQGEEHAEEVDEEMAQGRPPRLPARHERGEDHGGGGADVGPEQHGRASPFRDHASGGERDDEGHHGRRALQGHGPHNADGDDAERASDATARELGQELGESRLRDRGHPVLQQPETDEHEGEADDRLSRRARPAPLREQQGQGTGKDGQGKVSDGRLADGQGNQPTRDRGAEVGSEQHEIGLAEPEQADLDEADRHERGHAARLQQAGQAQAGHIRPRRVPRHGRDCGPEALARQPLDGLAHQDHAIDEEAEGTDELEDLDQGVHVRERRPKFADFRGVRKQEGQPRGCPSL